MARTKKNAKGGRFFPDQATIEAFQRMEIHLEEEKKGSFKADRFNDVLTASIGTPEHSGRLRGHSMGYTGIKNVYGKAKKKSHHDKCHEQIEQLKAMVLSQQQMVVSQQEMFNKMLEFLPPEAAQQFGVPSIGPSHFTTQVSSNIVGEQHIHMIDENPISCVLLINTDDGPKPVAYGRIYPCPPGHLVHHEPLPADCLKVSIDQIFDNCGELLVPFPVEKEDRIGALRTAILKWPACLVQTQDTTSETCPEKMISVEKVASASSAITRPPLINEAVLANLPSYYHKLHDALMNQPSHYTTYTFPTRKTCSGLKMRIIDSRRFRFMDPIICGEAVVNVDIAGTMRYMNEFAMIVKDNEYVFVPYNANAARVYWQERNVGKVGEMNFLRFVKISSPIQKGNKACGYYVMRFMIDIIEKYVFEGFPQSLEPLHLEYPLEKIEEAKKLALDFILKLF